MPSRQTGSFGLRFLLWLTGIFIALLLIIPLGFALFFNPNDYKTEIATLIQKQTGLPLTIRGDIQVHYFPWLGLHAKELLLTQPENFGEGDFIQAKEMGFKIPINALLQGKLTVETLLLNGLELHLIRKADGTSNWDQLRQRFKPSTKRKEPSSQQGTSGTPSNKKSLSFALSQFSIQNANIRFDDNTVKQTVFIKDLQIEARAQSTDQLFSVTSDFDLVLQNFQQSPKLQGQGKIKGTVSLNEMEKEFARLSTQFSLHMNDYPKEWQQIQLQAALIANESAIHLTDLDIKTAMHATGELTLPYRAQLPIVFRLAIDELNLDQLPFNPKKSAPVAKSENISTSTQSQTDKTHTAKQDRKLQGEVSIGTVRTKNVTLTQVKATVSKEAQVLKLNPLTATLYRGKLATQLTKDLNNPQAPTVIQGKITDMDLQYLLQAVKNEKRLSGKTDLDFSLNYAENPGLSGVVKCHITQGNLEGIDVKYYLLLAQSLLKKEKSTAIDSKNTPFQDLTATLRLHDNIVDNNDLLITSPDFKANGEGSINFATQTISYKLKVLRQYQDGKEHMNTLPLALRINGSLAHPKVEPDLDVYLKSKVKNEVSEKLNKQISKQLDKHLGKIIGAPNEGQTDSSNPEQSAPADNSTDKIDKAIKKGLDKLFK